MFIAMALACGLSTSTVDQDCRLAAVKTPLETREQCELVLQDMQLSLESVKNEGRVPMTAYIHDARCIFIPEAV